MGTRNLLTIIQNGKVKLAKYNQWDGYLDGQGKDLAEFIVNDLDFEKLISGLQNVKFTSENEYDEKLATIGITESMISFDQGDLITATFPLASRDTNIKNSLSAIQDLKTEIRKVDAKYNTIYTTIQVKPENLITSDASDFKNDGLFCEYAYELNLDNFTVKVFEARKNAKGDYFCDRIVIDCDILQYPEVLDAKLAEIAANNKG